VRNDLPLTSVEAFALALVEASSRLTEGMQPVGGRSADSAALDVPHDEADVGNS
jgi:hypothetical protein